MAPEIAARMRYHWVSGIAFFDTILHPGEWWFSIIDAIQVLTDSSRPRKYWADLKKKLNEEGFIELSEKIGQLK